MRRFRDSGGGCAVELMQSPSCVVGYFARVKLIEKNENALSQTSAIADALSQEEDTAPMLLAYSRKYYLIK